MANQMNYNAKDEWNSYGTIENIRRWARETPDCGHKETIKDIRLWNKMAKQLHLNNQEITSRWREIKNNYSSEYHIGGFIFRIFDNLRKGIIKLEDIGKIEMVDNGSRGSNSSVHMRLWNTSGKSILDACDINCNQFYYL